MFPGSETEFNKSLHDRSYPSCFLITDDGESVAEEVQSSVCFSHASVSGSVISDSLQPKTFDCVDHNKLWKILKEMGIPDHLTCLLRNLHASQEATHSYRSAKSS